MKENLPQARREYTIRPTEADVFVSYFPTATIEDSTLDAILPTALKYFEGKSKNLISAKDYAPNNFDGAWNISHQNGDITYAVHQVKTYSTIDDTESLVYLVDTRDKENIGHGEIRLGITNQSSYFKNKPFVGYTHTEKHHRREGLGTRRLYMMNAISQMLYGLPLHSDSNIGYEAKKVWEKLVAQGCAIRYPEGKNRLNRFVLTLYPVAR